MFTADQAKTAIGSLLQLEETSIGFTSISHSNEVKTELFKGPNGSIRQLEIHVNLARMSDASIANQVFNQFWRCTGFLETSKNDLLENPNYSGTHANARVDRLPYSDGWLTAKLTPIQV